jgi:hypothetical protein
MRIEVEMRNVYGVPKIYPVNEAGRVLAKIAGTVTLSKADLAHAIKLGLEVVEVCPSRLSQVAA